MMQEPAHLPTGEQLTAWTDDRPRGLTSTQAIIGLLVVFSLVSWVVLIWKYLQFRKIEREADLFLDEIERSQRLEDAYQTILSLPESPFTRVFRRGVNFFSELRPGALREGARIQELSPTQLEVLRLVLEKEEGIERDDLSHGLLWLAIIATVSPLMGLLGTVIGVMNAFIGVASAGSANITAVAPGVAEALTTTVAGLVVAIPAAIAYNYFTGRLGLLMGELEGFSSEFIGTLAREGRV
jgi:biopolymer transport protein TolQ